MGCDVIKVKQINSVARLFHIILFRAAKRRAATMSCLWIWCCRGREDDSDTDSKEKEKQQSEKRKKGKKKSGRRWRIHWKKEQRLINQRPVKVEEEAHVLGLPVGLASSLDNVSAETLEATAPPPQDSLTEKEDAAIQHLLKTLLDEVGTRMEQLLNVKKSHPPEDKENNKRKTRRGTRGKGRKIIYNKEKHPDDKLDGQESGYDNPGLTVCCRKAGAEPLLPRGIFHPDPPVGYSLLHLV
ncbi:hypothetical protein SRHO_G00116590 [Serrasalmus rhombeus]